MNYIKSLFNDNQEIHVILDIYSSHTSEETKEAARDLGIPAGYTDLYQPLDMKIFAIIKAYLRHMIRMYLREDRIMTKADACALMIRAWEKLEPDKIQEAFDEIINKGKWKGVNLNDLPLMHTCKYYKSSSEEKKKMILDALTDQSSKDQSDVPFIEYVLRAFGNSIKVSRDLVIKYVHENADFENEISVYSAN